MKVKNKNLQRKTIDLPAKEVQKAIIHFLEDVDHSYEEEIGGEVKYVGMKEGQKGQPILMGKNTSVEFNKDGSAVVTTYYGG